MAEPIFDTLKRYVGFSTDDAANLHALGEALAPAFDDIIDRFYRRVRDDVTVTAVLDESSVDTARFRRAVRHWLESLFAGSYGGDHFERVSRIGRSHVRIRLPLRYIIAAMNLIRTELAEAIGRLDDRAPAGAVLSVNKILDIELAVMLDSYREDYSQQVRQAERQRMEGRLKEVSHLANVGELAASLAHEIKNPLAGISGAIQVIRIALDPDDPRREIITEILSQIDRLDRTVRDLLIYAKPKPPSRTPKDLSKVVQRTLKFLRQEPALRGIRIRCRGLECDAGARIDESQIEQVISNLILNAADACEQGGDVTISLTSDREVVRIEIADTGQGMTYESVDRAFEPFFSTKVKGTGLGLAICKRIIEAHHGLIAIDSVEGKGTQVRIELPR